MILIGSHGHLLGAAGTLECLFALLACKYGQIPPTINMNEPEDEFKNVNFVANKSQKWPENGKKRIAVKNSFGFGGTNVSLIVSEYVN